MNIVLWVVQALLAFAFAMSGGMKIGVPPEQLLEKGMTFVNYTPTWLVKFIGISELAGALGLILPSATKILPKLTPLAAGLLGVVMVLALGTHLTHGEAHAIAPNIVLGGLAAFVAWGRTKKAPIAPKSSRAAAHAT